MNFYDGYYNTAKKIKNKKARAEFVLAILEYYFDDVEPDFTSDIADVAFEGIKLSLTKARNGRHGGQAKEANKQAKEKASGFASLANDLANAKQTPYKQQTTNNKQQTTRIVKREVREKTSFSPPTLSDVEEFSKQRNSTVDPKRFHDYFTAGNWKDAKGNQVKNWKQKFITWETHEPKTPDRKADEDWSWDG